MKTVLEIVQKHFSTNDEDYRFREWAFGFTNLGDYTNTQLIDIWNLRHGSKCETYSTWQYLIYVVLKMIYYWDMSNVEGWPDSAITTDEKIAKEKLHKSWAPVPQYISYETYVEYLKQNISNQDRRINLIEKELSTIKEITLENEKQLIRLTSLIDHLSKYIPSAPIKW